MSQIQDLQAEASRRDGPLLPVMSELLLRGSFRHSWTKRKSCPQSETRSKFSVLQIRAPVCRIEQPLVVKRCKDLHSGALW